MIKKIEVVKKWHRGFTLIELLAVILILAIIALIVIPIINNLVNEAKKEAFRDTATNVVDAAEKDCNLALQKNEATIQSYTVDDYEITSGQNLSISGKMPMHGNFAVNNACDIAIAVNNTKWCASKNYTDEKVTLTEYVDGNCNYTTGGSGGTGDGDPLLVDKINEIRGIELTSGVNIGSADYDKAILGGASGTYYTGKYFEGTNPNNYINVDGQLFRILGLTDQGIAVTGDIGSYATNNGYGNYTIDATFKSRYNDLGLVRKANYYTSTKSGDSNSFLDDEGYKIRYGSIVNNSFALVSFYDYELTIDRTNYASCLNSSAAADSKTAFLDCAQTSWLGNNINLNIGFFFYGTGAISPGYLSDGKFNIVDSAGNGDDGVCTDCTSKLKLLIRNDSYYVSGTGTETDPFVYKTAYDASKFTQTDCFYLDATGNVISGFDSENTACLKDITIPASINGKNITGISDSAFASSGITSVNFNSATNLTYIGQAAFADNLISGSLTLPANLTNIGDSAFASNTISGELIIPSSVVEIGYDSFRSNTIETLTFASNSHLSTIYGQAFSENYSLVGTINIPNTISEMEDSVFCWSNISTVNIPNTVSGLSMGAFNCTNNLTTINVDQIYNGMLYAPWGNSTATINWLQAETYNLTYDSAKVSLSNNCLSNEKYIGNCTVTLTSVQAGYKLFSYNLNGVAYTSNSFVMPNVDSAITDIVTVESYSLQSSHPYANSMNQTYTLTVPGATKIKITFSDTTSVENNYDKLYLTDSTSSVVGGSTYFTGGSLANQSFIVNGDTINVKLTSDGSVTAYGFYIDVVKYQ